MTFLIFLTVLFSCGRSVKSNYDKASSSAVLPQN